MDGRPFVLMGVNCDGELETIQRVSLRDHLTWRNWWNGGREGPLTARYGVTGFPTTLVIDPEGVIRYRGREGPSLEQAIETLVQQAERRRS
jgi:hypothetical protein